jgi:hypothetical protein
MKSSCDVIHDASNLSTYVQHALWNYIRRALCANKRPNSSRHVAQEAQCARSRCAKAPSRRPGHGGCLRLANVPHARRRAREGERSLQRDSKNIAHVPLNLPQHTSPDPKMPQDPRKGAIMAWARICVIIRENRNQTIKCRTKIKESIPLVNTTIPYHPEKESKQSKYR